MTGRFVKLISRGAVLAILGVAVTVAFAPASRADTTTPPATPVPAPAAPATPKAHTSYHGTITGVDATAGTITIQKGKEVPMTFTLAPDAKVTVDKQPSTLDKVPVGDTASIKSADGKTATSVHARAKVEKTPPPPATTPATPAPTT